LDSPLSRSLAWRALLLTMAVGLGILYASPALPAAAHQGLDWPLHYAGEPASLTTYGKWWLQGDGPWLADGFSGRFPTFYNYLADLLLNVLAALLGRPPMTVQVVLWGPLLAALLFVVDYAILAAVLRDRARAFLASVLISTAGASPLLALVCTSTRTAEVRNLLHLPFETVSLGTAQSLGWVLFLPSLGLLYVARHHFTVRRALAFGACNGLLLQAHTLTFVNAVAAQLAFLVAENLAAEPWSARTRVWLGALAGIALTLVGVASLRQPLTFPILASLGAAVFLVTFAVDPVKPLYVWGYGTTLLVAAPYLLVLSWHAREAPSTAPAPDAATPGELFAFFSVYVLAAALAFWRGGDSAARRWALAILVATALLATNHLWRWGNHPYRFAIDLVFPLAVLAALGVPRRPRLLTALVVASLAAPSLANFAAFWRGERPHLQVVAEDAGTAAFLRTVRETTERPETKDSLILNPPEHAYPAGVFQNALLFNYSRRPGFLPDFRYVLTPERYFNRVALFCFLFPGYPAYDLQIDRRACEEPLEPPEMLLVLRDRALAAAILPLYGIEYVAAVGRPFVLFASQRESDYGWEIAARGVGMKRLLRATPVLRPAVGRWGRGTWDDEGLHVSVEPDIAGPQLVVLGGRRLDERAPRILLDGRALESRALSGNWAILNAEMTKRPHRLELLWAEGSRARDSDYLYYAVVVASEHVSEYFGLAE